MKIKLLIVFMFISAGVSAQIQYLGAPNVTVVNRGNFKIDSILYLPKRIKTPIDSGALRYQISDSTLYLWTGSQWIKAKNDGTITSVSAGTGMSFPTITVNGVINADTTILSTRAWRKKGDDSLQANISLKVNISDTASMLTNYIRHGGYGLTKTGQALSVDTAAIATRSRVQKGIDSLGLVKQNVITNPVTGTGTTNYVSKWSGTSTQTISQIFDNGTNVGIGTTSPTQKLHISSGNLLVQRAFSSGNVPLNILNSAVPTKNQSFDVAHFQSNDAPSIRISEVLSSDSSVAGELTLSGGDGNVQVVGSTGALVLNAGRAAGSLGYVIGANHLRITSSGDVGVGTASPSYKLDILGTLRNTTGAAFATSSGNVLVGTTTDAGYKLDVSGTLRNTTGANFATSSGNVVIGGTGTGSYKLDITGDMRTTTGAVLASSSGNVGVGLTPFDKLDVNGAMRIRANTTNFAAAQSAVIDFVPTSIFPTEPLMRVYSVGDATYAGSISFGTSTSTTPNERMRISAAGNVGIGNTAPSEKLHVTGRIRATTIDSTATGMNMLYADATGVIKKAAVPTQIQTAEAVITGDYTVSLTDYFVSLPDLTTASRNVVLPNTAVNGRQLIIFNTSSDATFKWTFTNEDVEDASGAAITTLTDQKSYTMVYYNGKFRVTAIN